jgi:tRNA threonylcarbamoyladenosine biosynthesis protein TsaB
MLLAVDTSTSQIGLALNAGAEVAAELLWYSHRHHTIELAPAISELLNRAGARMNDIEAIAIATGPGSFTALRVGMALAKGLALSRNLPLVGIPTLDILAAAQVESALPLAAVLQAGRGRIALVWYRCTSFGSKLGDAARTAIGSWQAQSEPVITTVDELATSIVSPTLVAGELTADERARLAGDTVNVIVAPWHLCVRRPSLLAEIGRRRLQAGDVDDAAALSPSYLHLSNPVRA